MVALGILLFWLAALLLSGFGTARLCRRCWTHRRELPRAARVLPWFVALTALAGALGTLFGLVKAFSALGGESVDPAQKAARLAQGISEAMNATAFSTLFWLPSVVALALLARPKRASPIEE